MPVLIHAGMHKTGTTSIQHAFSGFSNERVEYLKWNGPNHSPLFALLCHDHPEQYHLFRKRGWSRELLLQKREEAARAIRETIRDNPKTFIFSGEDVSLARPGYVERLKDYFSDVVGGIQILLYIRPPASFLESAFQTRLRVGGLDRFDLDEVWPNYRYRVDKFDKCFGRENVQLRPFHPSQFRSEDVVLDFADVVGVTLGPRQSVKLNGTLSAEATALLYLQRKLGTGFGEPGPFAIKQNYLWFSKLDQLGSQKFRFANSLLDSVIQRHEDDLDWIESRLGCQLEDRRSSGGFEFASEQDLIDLALTQKEAVKNLLLEALENSDESEDRVLMRMLEALRNL